MDQKYELIEHLESARYVMKARERATGRTVAVKRIPYNEDDNGVPCRVIREVSILKELNHENIVRLLDVLPSIEETFLVFEYLDCDLKSFIRTEPSIDPPIIKKFLYQILSGVAFCHSSKVLHRNLNPDCILVDRSRLVLKLADFGLAREVGVPCKQYTTMRATIQYTPPEILLSYPHYSPYSFPVDIWAVGCIFGEMVKGQMFFHAAGTVDQIRKFFRILGTPNEDTWPGVTKLFPHLDMLGQYPQDLANEVPYLEPSGVDLLSKLLSPDPSKRITAHEALQHPYFEDH